MKVRKLLTSQLLRFAAFIVIFILPATLFGQLPNPGGGMGGGVVIPILHQQVPVVMAYLLMII